MGSIQNGFNYISDSVGALGSQAFGSVAGLFGDAVESVNDAFNAISGSLQ